MLPHDFPNNRTFGARAKKILHLREEIEVIRQQAMETIKDEIIFLDPKEKEKLVQNAERILYPEQDEKKLSSAQKFMSSLSLFKNSSELNVSNDNLKNQASSRFTNLLNYSKFQNTSKFLTPKSQSKEHMEKDS